MRVDAILADYIETFQRGGVEEDVEATQAELLWQRLDPCRYEIKLACIERSC